MKIFIRKVTSFIFILLFLAFFIDLFISNKLKNTPGKAGEIGIWEDIFSGNLKNDIAIYGSSRAWTHINPKIINDSIGMTAYNFGIDGHNFWLQYLRHKEYLKSNTAPKQIILSVDGFSLGKRKELYNYQQFLPYMLWNKNIFNFTSSYDGFSLFDYFIPLFRYSGETTILNSLLENINPEYNRINGYKGQSKDSHKDIKIAKERLSLNEESLNLFTVFIEECKNAGIVLTLVYTPVYISKKENISDNKDVVDFYRDIANRNNLDFYNYTQDDICFKKDMFYDPIHLNKKGAELFSRKFAHALNKARTHNNGYKE